MIAWNLWTSVPRVKLWEAVALVLEIDPRSLVPSPHAWMSGGPGREADPHFEPRSFPSKVKHRAFDEALEFATRAASHSGPIHIFSTPFQGMSVRRADVALPEVVKFFVGVGWPDIPEPLQSLVRAENRATAQLQPKAATEEVPDLAPQGGADDWVTQARAMAQEFIAAANGEWFPNQKRLAEQVAEKLRARGITGPSGTPLSSAYIKRHALKGIHSGSAKLRSIAGHRGK